MQYIPVVEVQLEVPQRQEGVAVWAVAPLVGLHGSG